MKTFFFAAALMTSGVAMAQTLPAPPALPAPAAEAAVDHLAMKPAAVPTTKAQAPAAPVATAQAAAVPPCSKAVHDECMNSSQTAKHGMHTHAGHHARHHHNKRAA